MPVVVERLQPVVRDMEVQVMKLPMSRGLLYIGFEMVLSMELNEFHCMLGQTIMYCQIIEHDIKMIYSAMCRGDMENTLDMIERNKWTLGHSVKELKKLDFSDNNSYISANDYNFLSQMAQKRDYWCHKTYLRYIYNHNFLLSTEYQKECQKLRRDNEKLMAVYMALEKVRIQAMHDFRRT